MYRVKLDKVPYYLEFIAVVVAFCPIRRCCVALLVDSIYLVLPSFTVKTHFIRFCFDTSDRTSGTAVPFQLCQFRHRMLVVAQTFERLCLRCWRVSFPQSFQK